MGRPKLTRSYYKDNWTKYVKKRPKYTPEQFDAKKNQCEICGGTHFYHELQKATNYKYQTYGYKTHRVLWRIKCANPSCYQPYGVILRPEHWDSVDS